MRDLTLESIHKRLKSDSQTSKIDFESGSSILTSSNLNDELSFNGLEDRTDLHHC